MTDDFGKSRESIITGTISSTRGPLETEKRCIHLRLNRISQRALQTGVIDQSPTSRTTKQQQHQQAFPTARPMSDGTEFHFNWTSQICLELDAAYTLLRVCSSGLFTDNAETGQLESEVEMGLSQSMGELNIGDEAASYSRGNSLQKKNNFQWLPAVNLMKLETVKQLEWATVQHLRWTETSGTRRSRVITNDETIFLLHKPSSLWGTPGVDRDFYLFNLRSISLITENRSVSCCGMFTFWELDPHSQQSKHNPD